MKFLFPDSNPPLLPDYTIADEACIWLLAVMNEDDASRAFIASLLTHFLRNGRLSQKQTDGLYKVATKVYSDHQMGRLSCQIGRKEPVKKVSNVIRLRPSIEDCEVLE